MSATRRGCSGGTRCSRLTAALSLAIGIGANTTIFTIANALLFKPPSGVAEPGRLVDVGRSQDGRGFDNGSYPNYLDIRARNTVFSGIYAYRLGAEPMSLGGPRRRRAHLRRHGDDELLQRPRYKAPHRPAVHAGRRRATGGDAARDPESPLLDAPLQQTTLLVSLLPTLPVPVDVTLALDGRAIAFTLGLSLVAAVLSGLAPALSESKARSVGVEGRCAWRARAAASAQRLRRRSGGAQHRACRRRRAVRPRAAAGDRDRSRIRSARRRAGRARSLARRLHGRHRPGLRAGADPSRLLGSLLFGVGATDPIAFVGIGGASSVAIGLAACYAPSAARPRSTRWKRCGMSEISEPDGGVI